MPLMHRVSRFPFHLRHRLLLFHPYSYYIKMFNLYNTAEMRSWVYFIRVIRVIRCQNNKRARDVAVSLIGKNGGGGLPSALPK